MDARVVRTMVGTHCMNELGFFSLFAIGVFCFGKRIKGLEAYPSDSRAGNDR